MKSRESFEPRGVIPACLLPFRADLEIDEAGFRKHLSDLAAVEGIAAITVNGHAAEVHALSFDEQRRCIELAMDQLGDSMPIVAGIFSGDSKEAGRLAAMATEAGADCLLVFPSEVLGLGGALRPESARVHVTSVAEATDLPLILFQYPLGSGLGYPMETLLALCDEFPTIRAIKDWCGDPHQHEQHIRELRELDRPVRVLSTHSMWLLGSLAMGCDGLLSGAGSVIADLQVNLWRAIEAGDLSKAQEVNNRIFPTVKAFYADPLLDMHNRMKEALVILGRLPEAHVRPPLVKLPAAEIERIRILLLDAGLLEEER